MFENLTTKPNPNEPEDMFAPVDQPTGPVEIKSALAHNKLKPVSLSDNEEGGVPAVPLAEGAGAEITPPLLSKKGIIIAIVAVIVLALGGGTAWVFLSLPDRQAGLPKTPSAPPTVVAPVVPEVAPAAPPVEIPPTVEVLPPVETVVPPPFVDTDADGLNDEEENAQGTNPQAVDTDSDELTDYEEIMIWKTNPLNPDSDGDTHLDGVEIKNNFNPNGPGKLLELPK